MKNFKRLIKLINFYPPYLAAGIKLKDVNEDHTKYVVQMKLKFYNRNLFGTHFGGSLYSMCDPFFVFILVINLGKEYIVWDKSANIKFKKPGKGTVTAIFEIKKSQIEEIKNDIDQQEKKKNTYFFKTEVIDKDKQVIAEIEKEVYVRKK